MKKGRIMKRCIVFFILLLSSTIFSQTISQKIQMDVQRENLSKSQGLYLEALALYAQEMLPTNLHAPDFQPSKCGFGLNYRIRHHWDSFDSNQKSVLQSFLLRPNMSFSCISPSTLFKVHYDTTGYHAVDKQDTDDSGIPDYVEKVTVIMDSVYSLEVMTLGYNPPPLDKNQHGPEWDVYIRNIYHYGSTEPEEQLSSSPVTYSSYIFLDNDYTHTRSKGLDGLRVTAAHEFFHMIQLGYNARDDDDDGQFDDHFFMEVSSTWMEDVAYDNINDYIQYLHDFFNQTNIPFNRMDGWREYGLCIWLHFLEKRIGSLNVVRDIWDEIINLQALSATARVLEKYNSSLREELPRFNLWNYFTDLRADTQQYYPEGESYPEIRLDGSFNLTQDTSIVTTVVPTGARYYQCMTEDETVFTFVISNTETFDDDTTTECSLSLKAGGYFPFYIDLGQNIKAQHFSEDEENWKTFVVIEDPVEGVVVMSLNPDSTEIDDIVDIACFPNPFIIHKHESTVIPFQMEKSGDVTIWIASASGYRILEKQVKGYFGPNQFQWDGKNEQGQIVPAGIYLYMIQMDNEIVKRNKIAVIR